MAFSGRQSDHYAPPWRGQRGSPPGPDGAYHEANGEGEREFARLHGAIGELDGRWTATSSR
jgi:hypothetical protein